MRKLAFTIALSLSAAAQQSTDLPPDTVVAIVNGKKVTADEVRKMIAGIPPVAQKAFATDPKQFMREHAWYMYTQGLAEKNGLDKESPYKENLEFNRMTLLVQAQWNHAFSSIVVTPEEQRKFYEENLTRYREAKAKLIYIPFSSQPATGDKKVLSEPESKAKAEMVVRQARAGADFVKLVREHSEDATSAAQNGDMGMAIRPATTQVPEPMRNAILALKAGEVSDALRHENGYYVFRAETSGVLPYEQVKDEIYKELKDRGFKKWQEKTKAESTVQFENESFFNTASQSK